MEKDFSELTFQPFLGLRSIFQIINGKVLIQSLQFTGQPGKTFLIEFKASNVNEERVRSFEVYGEEEV